eukprot:3821376-Alexandrium_andersonii.AAC.1
MLWVWPGVRTANAAVAPQLGLRLCFGRRNYLYAAAPTCFGRAPGPHPSAPCQRTSNRRTCPPAARARPG